MSTWHMLSDADDNFRWEPSCSPPHRPKPYDGKPNSALPSMTELLLQGCSSVLENREDRSCSSTPLFRTGSGAFIAPKESSVSRALAVLGDESLIGAQSGGKPDECGSFGSLFKTASGKKVCASSAALARAKALLGHDQIDDQPSSESIKAEGGSLFQTASGKKVSASSAALSRAKALLGHDEIDDQPLSESFMGEGGSLFQTASGKKFSASSAALARAKTLLEHDDIYEHPPSQSIKGDRTYGSKGFTHLEKNKNGANSAGFCGVYDQPPSQSIKGESLHFRPEMPKTNSTVRAPQIKFNTAGGRSISVSTDALKRARSLLGDMEQETLLDEVDAGDAVFPVLREIDVNVDYVNQRNGVNSFDTRKKVEGRNQDPKRFISSFETSSARNHLTYKSVKKTSVHVPSSVNPSVQNLPYEKPCVSGSVMPVFSDNGASRVSSRTASSGRALVHTSTTTNLGTDHVNGTQSTGGLKRTGTNIRVSPFKRPRNSKFTNPMNLSMPLVPSGLSNDSTESSCFKKRVSTRYPAQSKRIYIKDFFQVPPTPSLNRNLPEEVRQMHPGNAEKYVFCEETSIDWIDVEAFHRKLLHSGASLQYASKQWVANHYKWIVWKLACYERLSSPEYHGKIFSVSNVLEELKYRYEREVNHGHRSAIKKILEGDASPSSVLILCISAVSPYNNVEVDSDPVAISENDKRAATTIELTDGWYSINAQLDVVLSEYLVLGKLFVGQKLRICGARLCGWLQPVSPLQAPNTINLQLHANGTYRACWADRLGFCRNSFTPLAFTHIRSSGGPVPRVLVGVTRIYPVLYKESFTFSRLGNEVSIVRSEKAEAEVLRIYNQRCSNIIEGVTSDFGRGNYVSDSDNDQDSEEGAKMFKMLENAFEPEVLMAEMSHEQLASVTKHQAKLESHKQLEIERAVKKALEDAGLTARNVSPFMRVRVVGLTYKGGKPIGKGPKEGLLTIWNPSENQQLELVEGQAYSMSGLVPLHSSASTLFLHARGATLNWKPITSTERECFESFFNPRESILLSNLGEVSLSSEFDTCVLVLYVGKEYVAANQRRQWVFVTDGSTSELGKNEHTVSLLAISFSSSCTDTYAVSPVNHKLVGSIVGFCNLIKRSRDESNDLWVAEATENSTYYLNYDHACPSHLSQAFASVQKWTGRSSKIMEMLREKVLFIVGDHKS